MNLRLYIAQTKRALCPLFLRTQRGHVIVAAFGSVKIAALIMALGKKARITVSLATLERSPKMPNNKHKEKESPEGEEEFVYRGRRCLIRHSPTTGALCGYVELKPGDKWFGCDYCGEGQPDIDVCGGVTWSENCFPNEPETEEETWVFGFDCAHFGDACPAFEFEFFPDGEFRDINYVEKHVRNMCGTCATRYLGRGEYASERRNYSWRSDRIRS